MLGPFVFKWNGGWSDGVGMRDVGERLRDYQSGFKSMWKQKQNFFFTWLGMALFLLTIFLCWAL